jgi:long-chain acyl-CoA synthetase
MAETLIGIFLEAVSRPRPEQFMRKVGDRWESIPSDRALADVEQVGLGLASLGVGPGDRVALLSENRYEWAVADLGILGIGAITVPIYPTLTPEQTRFVLDDAGATVVIVSSADQLAKVHAVLDRLPGAKWVVSMSEAARPGPRDLPLAALMAKGAEAKRATPGAFVERASRVKPDDVATIIYTSGTTGEPKGAMLTHRNVASNVTAALEIIDVSRADLNLSFLPLCHIFERMAGFYAALAGGSCIAYAQSMETVAADAVEVRPTWLTGVPRFYEKVYARVVENAAKLPPLRRRIFHWGLGVGLARARARFAGNDRPPGFSAKLADRLVGSKIRERVGGRLRFAVSGSAPLAPNVMEFFFAIGIPVLEGYGLTETSPVITLNRPGKEKPGSVGPPIPGVEIRIGEQGEILTRGPHVMKGYFKREEATREALRDGWFHTGDIGEIDAEGRLKITDRLKELIVLATGKKVAPQPIEGRLKTSPWIAEAVLIGEKRPYISCLIVPDFARLEKEAQDRGWRWATRAELVGHADARAIFEAEIGRLNADLARFEQIRRFEIIPNELTQDADELTPSLKVKRRVIDRRYAEPIRGMYVGHDAPAA